MALADLPSRICLEVTPPAHAETPGQHGQREWLAAPWRPTLWRQQRLDEFLLKIQDGAIMARGRHIGGRFIGNRREAAPLHRRCDR